MPKALQSTLLNWIRNRLDALSEQSHTVVDPMVSVGKFMVRCNPCGELFRASSRFVRACRDCKMDNAFLRNVPRGLRVEV